jgi:Rieske Fe-S protein
MSEDTSNEDVENEDSEANETPDAEASDGEATAAVHWTRRYFFETASVLLGGVVSVVPAIFGLVTFCDPLGKRKKKPIAHQDHDSGGPEGYIRVASVAALSSGTPQRFAVIDDQIDAWNFTPDQPIGAVYIEKPAAGNVRVFNATCPHAGCSVSCEGERYLCPCHNSAFNLDGSKLLSSSGRANPSPRGLDTLEYEIKNDEIWVEFKNFYTGKHKKKPKE